MKNIKDFNFEVKNIYPKVAISNGGMFSQEPSTELTAITFIKHENGDLEEIRIDSDVKEGIDIQKQYVSLINEIHDLVMQKYKIVNK